MNRTLSVRFGTGKVCGNRTLLEREGEGREGKGREGKGREGKGREGKGREGKGKGGFALPCVLGQIRLTLQARFGRETLVEIACY